MDRDNVTSIAAHKLADKIMAEWISAYSDNGAIWQTAYDELQRAKANEAEAIYREAVEIAQKRWRVIHNLD
jgi:hypothetical protein